MISILFICRTYINRPSSSWIDDYFDWASFPTCCKYFSSNNSFCPHSSSDDCQYCEIIKNDFDRPNVESFSQFLPYFLQGSPDQQCSKAGNAAYSGVIINNTNLNILFTNFSCCNPILGYFFKK